MQSGLPCASFRFSHFVRFFVSSLVLFLCPLPPVFPEVFLFCEFCSFASGTGAPSGRGVLCLQYLYIQQKRGRSHPATTYERSTPAENGGSIAYGEGCASSYVILNTDGDRPLACEASIALLISRSEFLMYPSCVGTASSLMLIFSGRRPGEYEGETGHSPASRRSCDTLTSVMR